MAFPGGMMGGRQEGMDPEQAQQMQMVKYVSMDYKVEGRRY